MLNTILCCIVSFFAAFGVIQFIIFIYSEIGKKSDAYFVTIPAKNAENKIEGIVRTAFMNNLSNVIVVDMNSRDNTAVILEKLKDKYENLTVFSYDEYINYLQNQG